MANQLTGGTLTGAYGRDAKYTSAEQMMKDFDAGKDFVLHTAGAHGYCSKRDFAPGAFIQFRWDRNTKTAGYWVK